MKKYLRYSFILIGAAAGFAYYYYIGCKNGCPIQSNPYISTLYGAALGLIFALPSKKKEKKEKDIQGNDN